MINLVYPIYAAEVCAAEVIEARSHRHHPDAKALDADIAKIAKDKLGIKSTEGIQVVDDLKSGVLAQSWGVTYLGSLAKPVIAVQAGMEIAPSARKYIILRELYKCSSSLRMKETAIKVAQVAILVGLMMTGVGFYAMIGYAIGLCLFSYLITVRMNYNCTLKAHQFAINEIDEKDRPQIKAAFAAMNAVRDANNLMTQDVIEEMKMDKPAEEPFIAEVNKTLAKANTIIEELNAMTTIEEKKGELQKKVRALAEDLKSGTFTAKQEASLREKMYALHDALAEIREIDLKRASLINLLKDLSDQIAYSGLTAEEAAQLPITGGNIQDKLQNFKAIHDKYTALFTQLDALAKEFAAKKLSPESKSALLEKLGALGLPKIETELNTAEDFTKALQQIKEEKEKGSLSLMEKGKLLADMHDMSQAVKESTFLFDHTIFAPLDKGLEKDPIHLGTKINLDGLTAAIDEEMKKFQVGADEMKESLAQLQALTSSKEQDLKSHAEAFFTALKALRERHLSLTQRLFEKWVDMGISPMSALELPYKLRPSGDKADAFYKEREAYHLQDLDKTKMMIQTIPAVVTLLAMPKLVEPLVKINPLMLLPAYGIISQGIALALTPAANWIGHYAIDWEFKRSTKQAIPAKLDPAVWQGAF